MQKKTDQSLSESASAAPDAPGTRDCTAIPASRKRGRPDPRRQKRVLFACLAFFAVLLTMRVLNILQHTPEYDEIWTAQHYVNEPVATIFSDVSVPNNHVLNTLAVKCFLRLIPNRLLAIRMTSLLAFCGLCFVLLQISMVLLEKNAARGALLAAVLLNGMLLHYAETSRGYSLQVFFVAGLFLSLLRTGSGKPEDRLFNACMWLICAMGACLSISTGALYVTILTGLWGLLYIPFRAGIRKNWHDCRTLIAAGLCWSVFVLAWYGGNFTEFAKGRAAFGESFQSVPQYLRYCLDILLETGLIWSVPFLLLGAVLSCRRPEWRIFALTGGAAAVMLGTALITKGGPARVYLPLLPIAFSGAAVALDDLLKNNRNLDRCGIVIFLAVFAACAWHSESRRKESADPEWITLFPELSKMDPRIFIVHRPTDLYVLTMLFQDAVQADNNARMTDPEMLMLLRDNFISPADFDSVEVEKILPDANPVSTDVLKAGRDLPYWLYRLRPVRSGEPLDGKTVLCFAAMPLRENAEYLKNHHFFCVNIMLFNRTAKRCYVATGNNLDADSLLKMEKNNPDSVSFRVVSD